MQWVAALPPQSQSIAVGAVAGQWAAHDSNAALTWAQSFKDQPRVYDNAIGAIASQLVPTNPQSAVDWAMTINDDGHRAAVTEQVIEFWRMRDPAAVSEWERQFGAPTPTPAASPR